MHVHLIAGVHINFFLFLELWVVGASLFLGLGNGLC